MGGSCKNLIQTGGARSFFRQDRISVCGEGPDGDRHDELREIAADFAERRSGERSKPAGSGRGGAQTRANGKKNAEMAWGVV